MKRRVAAAGFVALAVPFSAFAQLPQAGEAMGKTEATNVTQPTEYDFEVDDVVGNPVKPNELNVDGEAHFKTSSLLNVRTDFVPEMMKSVEGI